MSDKKMEGTILILVTRTGHDADDIHGGYVKETECHISLTLGTGQRGTYMYITDLNFP
jgi:hypothetical protein